MLALLQLLAGAGKPARLPGIAGAHVDPPTLHKEALNECCELLGEAGELPAAWSLDAEHEPSELPRWEQPAADPLWYMEEHGPKFGSNTRNVLHIAPQVHAAAQDKLPSHSMHTATGTAERYLVTFRHP
jgi:hypothetical protein